MLWLEVGKGVLLLEHLAPIYLMAVDYYGSQLAGRFGWVALHTLKRQVLLPISWCAGIACNMTCGPVGAFGCGL